MNRLDFSDIFKNNKKVEDYNQNFEAIDAIFNLISDLNISKVEWVKESNYDLSFKITSEQNISIKPSTFNHRRKFMSIDVENKDNNITDIHITYNSRC